MWSNWLFGGEDVVAKAEQVGQLLQQKREEIRHLTNEQQELLQQQQSLRLVLQRIVKERDELKAHARDMATHISEKDEQCSKLISQVTALQAASSQR